MRGEDWTHFETSDTADVKEFETPLRYVVPFVWGSLRVTEEAHEAYGLVPLTAGVMYDAFPQPGRSLAPPALDVWLQGPHENVLRLTQGQQETLNKLAGPTEMEDGGVALAMMSRPILHPAGVAMSIRLPKDRHRLEEYLADSLVVPTGDEYGDELQMSTHWDDIGPLSTDSLRQYVPQIIAHALSEGLHRMPQLPLEEWQRGTLADLARGRLRRIGGATIGRSGLLATPALLPLPGGWRLASAAVSAASGLFGAAKAYKLFSAHLEGVNQREAATRKIAALACKLAANDMHDTYCAAQFNAQAKALLAGGPTDADT